MSTTSSSSSSSTSTSTPPPIVSDFPEPEFWKVQLQPNQGGVHNIRSYRSISAELCGTLLDGQIFPVYEQFNGWVNVGIGWAIIHATGNSIPSLVKVEDIESEKNLINAISAPLKSQPSTWQCRSGSHNIRKSRSVDSTWVGQLSNNQEFPVFEQVDGWVNLGIGWAIITAIGNTRPSLHKVNDEHRSPVAYYKCTIRDLGQPYNIRASRTTVSTRVGELYDGQIFPVYEIIDGWVNLGIGWAIITPLREQQPHLIKVSGVEGSNTGLTNPDVTSYMREIPMLWTCILINEDAHNIRQSRSVNSEWVGQLENHQTFPVYEEVDGWVNVGIGWSIITALGNDTATLIPLEEETEDDPLLYKVTFQEDITIYNIRKERSVNSTLVGQLSDGQIFPGYEETNGWLNVGIGWVIMQPLRTNTPMISRYTPTYEEVPIENQCQVMETCTRIPYTWTAVLRPNVDVQNIRRHRSLEAPKVGKVFKGANFPVYEICEGWAYCGLGWLIIQPDPKNHPPILIDTLADEPAVAA